MGSSVPRSEPVILHLSSEHVSWHRVLTVGALGKRKCLAPLPGRRCSRRAPKEHFRAPRGPAHLTGRMGYRLEVGGPRFPSPVCTEKFNHAAWALPGDPAGAGAPLTSALGVDPAHSSRRPRRVLPAFPGALPARPRRHTPSTHAPGHAPRVGTHPITSKDTPPRRQASHAATPPGHAPKGSPGSGP